MKTGYALKLDACLSSDAAFSLAWSPPVSVPFFYLFSLCHLHASSIIRFRHDTVKAMERIGPSYPAPALLDFVLPN